MTLQNKRRVDLMQTFTPLARPRTAAAPPAATQSLIVDSETVQSEIESRSKPPPICGYIRQKASRVCDDDGGHERPRDRLYVCLIRSSKTILVPKVTSHGKLRQIDALPRATENHGAMEHQWRHITSCRLNEFVF
eukprot:4708650-Pleurochrysis_carterae.AAC.1